MQSSPLVRRVVVRNYKSIGKCDVELGRFTLLVGRNGSGKSNFLDVFRFVVEGLQTSLDHAIRTRGGIEAVRRKSQGHPHNFAVAFYYDHPEGVAEYGFEIKAQQRGGFTVKEERLSLRNYRGEITHRYRVVEGQVDKDRTNVEGMPLGASDRLYLVTASGRQEFRGAYEALLGMGVYNLNPDVMKDVQSPDAGDLLRRDGSNLASVISRIASDTPELKGRIRDHLQGIVPGVVDFDRFAVGPKETVEFRQEVLGSQAPWRFYAESMSDGTLRALGVLVAVNQVARHSNRVRLVGIEEPETALHPAAASALMEALREATAGTQVLLTTHSPELLDAFDPESDGLLVVAQDRGETTIASADDASLKMIREHLYSAGELLRLEQINQSSKDRDRQERQTRFWDDSHG